MVLAISRSGALGAWVELLLPEFKACPCQYMLMVWLTAPLTRINRSCVLDSSRVQWPYKQQQPLCQLQVSAVSACRGSEAIVPTELGWSAMSVHALGECLRLIGHEGRPKDDTGRQQLLAYITLKHCTGRRHT